jgi:chemotaxis protein methyltransferase CheR
MDAWEYNYIRRKTLLLTGIDLNDYKAPQMQRRLQVYLNRSGYPNWPRFFQTLQGDAAALNQFKNYLTINVSSFFRDPDKYQHLQTVILPEILRHRASLRVWSAGCSHGQEAYSVAILLAEATGSSTKHHILATDIDTSALERGRAGGPYLADELVHIPPPLRETYFNSQPSGYQVNEPLRRSVIFRQHNLLADPFAGSFDLIICRNVVIYFEPAAKEKLYQRFCEALRPGGVLFVGGTEIVSKAVDIGLEPAGISFYRRKERWPQLKANR